MALEQQEAATFYVATGGNDDWSGSLPEASADGTDGPFATLARARNAARDVNGAGGVRRPVTVWVRGGKYTLERTLVLGPEDSGTRECPIAYRAHPGEKPILSGGRKVTGWQPYQGKILQCSLPGSKGGKWKFRQLFYNGERQIRARYPNVDPEDPRYRGWAFMEGPADDGTNRAARFPGGVGWNMDRTMEGGVSNAFHYKPGTFPHRWAKPSEGEVNMFPGRGWGNDIIPIKSVDEERRVITLTRDVRQYDRSQWFVNHGFWPNLRFRVENLLEELDEPGEWCLDSEEGTLYFWPPDDEIASGEVVVPALDCLIDMRGVSWVHIAGFTLTETLGGDDLQHEDSEGCGVMYPRQGLRYCGDGIRLKRAEYCRIEGNYLYALGGNAVYLEGYNLRNVIRGNEISEAGANGVCLVGSALQHPMFNEVLDNEIHDCGVILKYVAGVFFGLSDGNIIGHNYIHHVPHHAINLTSNGHGRNVIEYNEIRHTSMETMDNGAINSWGDVPINWPRRDAERSGHVIRYNLIADTWGCHPHDETEELTAPDPISTNGIYLDDFTSNCFVYGNIILRAGTAIMIHAGKNNFCENNILVDSRYPVRYWDSASSRFATGQMRGFITGNHFCRNIVYASQAGEFLYNVGNRWTDKVIARADENVFWNGEGGQYLIDNLTDGTQLSFADWQKMGYDTQSVIGDPLFVDPEHDDYRLRPESPAFAFGFQPIDVSKIGLTRKEKR